MNFRKKLAGLTLAFAMTFSAASAMSTSELLNLLVSLGIIDASQVAVVNAAVGGTGTTTGSADCEALKAAPNMTLESQGANVTMLQNWLIAEGYSIPAGATGYFGAQTQAALAAYQAANGITPAAGYFGPITRASIVCAPVVVTPPADDDDTTTPGTGLQGGEGYFDVETIADAAVEIDLGDSDTVIEVEVEAVDSDITIDRVDFMFSRRPWLYFSEVNLLIDGREVSTLSRSGDFREIDGEWRARFTGVDLTVREGDFAEIAIEVVVLNSMAGTRDEDPVNVTLPLDGIRGFDGLGLQQYGPSSAVGPVTVTFDNVFGDGDIRLTVGDNSPEKATIILDKDNRTNNVTVLEFDVEARNSDVELKDVVVTATTTTGSTVGEIVRTARLYRGTSLLKTKTVDSHVIEFKDVDYLIREDDTRTLRVELDFNAADGLALGDFEIVNVAVDAEDGDYEPITTTTLPVTETHTLVVEGLVANHVSTSASTSQLGDSTIATVTYVFDLTAVEETFYIREDANGVSSTLGTDLDAIAVVISSDDASLINSGEDYRISKGQTRRFTVEVQVQSGTTTGVAVSGRPVLNTIQYWTEVGGSGTSDTVSLGAPEYRSSLITVQN